MEFSQQINNIKNNFWYNTNMFIPDPNCRYCKGSGKIPLLIKVVDCECLKRIEDQKEDIIKLEKVDDNGCSWEIKIEENI